MSGLTKRQHYVPDFYVRQWADASGRVTVHDIIENKVFSCDPVNVLLQRLFYEENPQSPDNRIENILATMEGKCSTTFRHLQHIGKTASGEHDKRQSARILMNALSDEDVNNILDFAAYQYLRVPGAIAQKEFETRVSSLSDNDREQALNPGRFVESGYSYIKARFKGLKVTIFISPGTEFITSDWPCFDLKDSETAPLLGEEIGRDPKVVCYMALTPLLGAVLTNPDFNQDAATAPRLVAIRQPDSVVRNQNTLVIQQAESRVVASREEKFIFEIAARRKKNRTR